MSLLTTLAIKDVAAIHLSHRVQLQKIKTIILLFLKSITLSIMQNQMFILKGRYFSGAFAMTSFEYISSCLCEAAPDRFFR